MSARPPNSAKTKPRCPICRDVTTADYRPFCSRRCADVDLGRWLNGTYAIGGHEDDDEDGVSMPGLGGQPVPDSPDDDY